MPKKIRELKKLLKDAGYSLSKKRGKGSHSWWVHPLLPRKPINLPGKDSDDAKRYLEKQVNEALEALRKLEDGND